MAVCKDLYAVGDSWKARKCLLMNMKVVFYEQSLGVFFYIFFFLILSLSVSLSLSFFPLSRSISLRVVSPKQTRRYTIIQPSMQYENCPMSQLQTIETHAHSIEIDFRLFRLVIQNAMANGTKYGWVKNGKLKIIVLKWSFRLKLTY